MGGRGWLPRQTRQMRVRCRCPGRPAARPRIPCPSGAMPRLPWCRGAAPWLVPSLAIVPTCSLHHPTCCPHHFPPSGTTSGAIPQPLQVAASRASTCTFTHDLVSLVPRLEPEASTCLHQASVGAPSPQHTVNHTNTLKVHLQASLSRKKLGAFCCKRVKTLSSIWFIL